MGFLWRLVVEGWRHPTHWLTGALLDSPRGRNRADKVFNWHARSSWRKRGTLCLWDIFVLKHLCQLHLIEVSESDFRLEVSSVVIYNHPREIWNIAPSPSDPNLLFTCYNTGLVLYTAYPLIKRQNHRTRISLFTVADGGRWTRRFEGGFAIARTRWECKERSLATIRRYRRKFFDSICRWKEHKALGFERVGASYQLKSPFWSHLNPRGEAVVTSTMNKADNIHSLGNTAWNPHNSEEVATTLGPTLQGWDLRSAK